MRPSSTTPLVATAPGVVVFGEFADETQGSLNGDDTDEEPCFSRARKRATALAKKYQLVICFALPLQWGWRFLHLACTQGRSMEVFLRLPTSVSCLFSS